MFTPVVCQMRGTELRAVLGAVHQPPPKANCFLQFKRCEVLLLVPDDGRNRGWDGSPLGMCSPGRVAREEEPSRCVQEKSLGEGRHG